MSSDPVLKSAIAHWGPRFIANGVVLTDFEELTGSLASYDDWCRAWSQRAAHHEQLGRDALAKKHFLTAGECLQRAGVYYHFASFLFTRDMAQMKAAHKKQIACRQAALPYLDPPGERVDIPYEGKTLAGILRKPKGIDKPPVVVMAVGLDSTKEETDAYEVPFLARGIATLVFEGPGQGEGQYDFAIRGDYEVPVHAVLDYVETRRDLDTSRIGMWGVEPRRLLCPARHRVRDAHQGLHRARRAVRVLQGLGHAAAGHARGDPLAHACGLRRGSSQEYLQAVVGRRGAEHHGADLHRQRKTRPFVPASDAERLAREVKGPVELMIVEDGNHIATNRAYRWRSQSADWLKEKLGRSSSS